MLLTSFPKKKTWVAGTTGTGQFDCLGLKRTGDRVEIEEIVSCTNLSELPSDVSNLVIHSERILISNESFPSVKEEVLRLQIEERIRPLGPWGENTPLHHCISQISKGNTLGTYAIISLPQNDIERHIVAAQESKIRIRRCIPHVASISALSGRLTKKPIMCCLLDSGYIEILVSEKGIPYYSQISPIDQETGIDFDVLAQAIFNVRQIFSSRFNKNIKKLLFFSKKLTDIPEKIGDESVWKPNLDDFIIRGDKSLFWKYPELVGAPFVPDDFDCLPKDLKRAYQLRNINKRIASAALAASLALGFSGLFLQNRYDSAIKRYNTLYSATVSKNEEVLARMPHPEEARKVALVLSVYEEILQEKPIDSLLYSIARKIPEKVIIKELKASRQEAGQQTHKTRIPPPEKFIETEQQDAMKTSKQTDPFYKRPLNIQLVLLTKGNFQEVKTRLEKAVNLLGQGFKVGNVSMSYAEDSSRGLLKCNLSPKGEKRG